MIIGDKLKKLRTEKGLSQKDLSSKSGISLSTIIAYENNLRSAKLEDIHILCHFFDMPLEYFVDEKIQTLGKRIKSVRKNLKMTQVEFAKKLIISQSYLSGLEKDSEMPSKKLLKLISHSFNIDEAWLETGKNSTDYNLDGISNDSADMEILVRKITEMVVKEVLKYFI